MLVSLPFAAPLAIQFCHSLAQFGIALQCLPSLQIIQRAVPQEGPANKNNNNNAMRFCHVISQKTKPPKNVSSNASALSTRPAIHDTREMHGTAICNAASFQIIHHAVSTAVCSD